MNMYTPMPGMFDFSTTVAPSGRTRLMMLGLFVAVLAIATLPLWFAEIPPLNDYPFHIARIHILRHLDDTPFLSAVYERRSFLLPNMAMDLLVLGLSSLLPLEIAGRVFLGLTLALMLGGTVWLHYALTRRLEPWPLVAALFLHNWILLFGFLNFLFGAALILWALGSWIMVARRSVPARLAVGVTFALLLFWSHMVALAIYGIALGAIELQRALSRPARQQPLKALTDLVIAGATMLPPMVLFLASATSRAAGGDVWYQPKWWWKPFVFVRNFMSGNLYVDAVTAVVCLFLVVSLLRWARVRLVREMRWAVIVLLVTFIAMPFALFSAQHVDIRIPMVLWFIFVASLQVNFAYARHAVILAGVAALLLAGRMVAISADWARFDQEYAQFTEAFRKMPAEGTMAVASAVSESSSLKEWMTHWRPQITHVSALAVLDKPRFVTTIWAHPSQQPIVVRPPFIHQYEYQDNNPMPAATAADLEHLARALEARGSSDPEPHRGLYLLLLYPKQMREAPPQWHRLASSDKFILFEIAPGQQSRTGMAQNPTRTTHD
jgi:hypothetical protein